LVSDILVGDGKNDNLYLQHGHTALVGKSERAIRTLYKAALIENAPHEELRVTWPSSLLSDLNITMA
jgi:hypothetical protein